MKLVTVAVFENSVKAHLELVKLEDEGIEANLIGVDGFRSSQTGNADIQLLVCDEDYERALGVLGIEGGGDTSASDDISLHFVGWLLTGPIVVCSFLIFRLLFSILLPEIAASKGLVFVFIGPLAGSFAAYSFAPKHKKAAAALAFTICLGVAWNLK